MEQTHQQVPIAISMGDPCGIGPDVLLKAIELETPDFQLPDFFVVGDGAFLKRRSTLLGYTSKLVPHNNGETRTIGTLPFIDTGFSCDGIPGKPTSRDAELTIEAIQKCVEYVKREKASALVTCPINKKTLYDVGFSHPGHTEFLAELDNKETGNSSLPVMMLVGPELRTIPVTIHIPLAEVPRKLTTELIIETARVAHEDLSRLYGIKSPRLALAGLNPHAGEDGALGEEDGEFIKPAVEYLRSKGIDATGPLPADTMFHEQARKMYDVALCMYHDQALIPAKMLGFDDAVNVTLGLSFIRTSPDHGTAYGIAGTGTANPSSFIAALNMAAEMAGRK